MAAHSILQLLVLVRFFLVVFMARSIRLAAFVSVLVTQSVGTDPSPSILLFKERLLGLQRTQQAHLSSLSTVPPLIPLAFILFIVTLTTNKVWLVLSMLVMAAVQELP